MSFIHVLSTIGKGALGVGSKIAPLLPIPGPIGALIGAGLTVADQELSGAPGPEKKAAAMAALAPMLPDHPNKAQIISSILEGLVAVFSGIGQLYPGPEPPAASPPK